MASFDVFGQNSSVESKKPWHKAEILGPIAPI